jgi:hypothetical protein
MANIQVGFTFSMILYSLVPILFVQAVLAVLYFMASAPYKSPKPFHRSKVLSVVIDERNSPFVEVLLELPAAHTITGHSIAFTRSGMSVRTPDPGRSLEVPYWEMTQIKYGRMRPLGLLDAAITFSLAIPITLAFNGPFANWEGIHAAAVVGIAGSILAVVLCLGAFFNSKYLFVEVHTTSRGRIGLKAKESPAFGLNDAKRISIIVQDFILQKGESGKSGGAYGGGYWQCR